MSWAFSRSMLGPAFGGASCESTAPKTGSTTSLALQHGQVTFRFSPSLIPMGSLYSFRAKKEGHDVSRPCERLYGVWRILPQPAQALAGFSPRVKPGAGRNSGRT